MIDVSSGFELRERKSAWPSRPARSEVGRKLHAIEFVRGRRHAVDRRQIGIDKAVVGGERIHEVAVVPHQVADEKLGFLRHRHGGFTVELRISPAVARGRQHAVKTQPLRNKLIQRLVRPRVVQHLRVIRSTPSGVDSSPRAAAVISASSGIVSQRV